jgi:hypothetical protein
MRAHVGDRIVVESKKALQPSRSGVIEEVLQDEPTRVRVRWEDGHISILAPSAGVATIVGAADTSAQADRKPKPRAKAKAKAPSRASARRTP